MKILVINGPNLNMLGRRDPSKYGCITLGEINAHLMEIAEENGCLLEFYQSNHEGNIIDFLQRESSRQAVGILINPGALVRYGYSLRQSLIDIALPVIEVHMSDINKTGTNKKVNVLDDVRIAQFTGLKEQSYYRGLSKLITLVKQKRGKQK